MKLKVNRFYKTRDDRISYVSGYSLVGKETLFSGVMVGTFHKIWFWKENGLKNNPFSNESSDLVDDHTSEWVNALVESKSKTLSEFLFDATAVFGKSFPMKLRLPSYEEGKYFEVMSGESRNGCLAVHVHIPGKECSLSWVDKDWEEAWELFDVS